MDLLANFISKLMHAHGFAPDAFFVELIYRTSIPDNITNWKVFYDDQEIINFLTTNDTFKDIAIDENSHDQSLTEVQDPHDS